MIYIIRFECVNSPQCYCETLSVLVYFMHICLGFWEGGGEGVGLIVFFFYIKGLIA